VATKVSWHSQLQLILKQLEFNPFWNAFILQLIWASAAGSRGAVTPPGFLYMVQIE